MEIKCGKCRKNFEPLEELVVKKGPLFLYYSCPHCQKIVTVKNSEGDRNSSSEEILSEDQQPLHKSESSFIMTDVSPDAAGGVPFTITRPVRQQLYDLGYSQQDVDQLTPQAAQDIIQWQRTKAAAEKPAPPTPPAAEVPGWLIVHDETVRPQTFDLKVGKNIIGRRSSMPVDIAIETEDMTMSRQHCVVEVVLNERTGEYNFFINDFKSTNGTIVNGKVQRKLNEQDVVFLSDGDTFQLGTTKIVLRKNHELQRKEAVVKEVLDQPYMPTIVINQEQIRQVFKS